MATTSEATTRGIRVHVESMFVPERSDPTDGEWFFAYRVTIENHGYESATLRDRHWVITDANGEVQEVRGPGVVGEQPRLEPGQGFQYTSACPLSTSFGLMQGSYTMVTDDGDEFDAKIAAFALTEPHGLN